MKVHTYQHSQHFTGVPVFSTPSLADWYFYPDNHRVHMKWECLLRDVCRGTRLPNREAKVSVHKRPWLTSVARALRSAQFLLLKMDKTVQRGRNMLHSWCESFLLWHVPPVSVASTLQTVLHHFILPHLSSLMSNRQWWLHNTHSHNVCNYRYWLSIASLLTRDLAAAWCLDVWCSVL